MQHQSITEIFSIALSHAEPVTYWIVVLIGSIFTVVVSVIIYGYKHFYVDYRAVEKVLSRFNRNDGTREDIFLEIRAAFRSTKALSHPWHEFEESLVKERKEDGEVEYRNTHEAQTFFNVDSVISSSRAWLFNFRMGTFGSIPNILTGLGIVGTFYGILSGIPEDVATDAISKGIPRFLVGMKGAFLASISGMVFALIFTLIEKYLMDVMESQCRRLSERLDTIFRRRTEQDGSHRVFQSC